MGAARKLQAEIDRTLKKVQEGMNEFDEIWNKVYDTDNANQREKYEADLKKEIKKLQRLRDQIKTWIANNDIKDKTALVDARKAIEREMERFKVCEKEAKTKAFSKAGLGLQAKLDPEEKAKQDSRDWLNDQVETLQIQIDECEAEIEGLASQTKKGKAKPHRYQHLEESVERHKSHIIRLEQVMRCLDNDTITAEEVEENLKDMVEWYVSENQQDPSSFENVDDTYGDLVEKLDAVAIGSQPAPVKAKKTAKEQEDQEEKERERERERERASASALKAQLHSHGVASSAAEDDKKAVGKVLGMAGIAGPPTQSTAPASPTAAVKKKVNFAAAVSSADGLMPATGAAMNAELSTAVPGSTTQVAAPAHTVAQKPDGPAHSGVSFASLAAGRALSGPPPSAVQHPPRQPSVWGMAGQENDMPSGDENAFPRLGSNAGDNRQKSMDLQLQDVRQQAPDSSTSPAPSALGQAPTQAGFNAAKVVASVPSASADYNVGRSSFDISQGSTANLDPSTTAPSPNASLSEQQRNRTQDSEAARLTNIVDLNQLIAELSLEGTRSEITGVASGPGHYEGNPAASLQLLQACCRRSMPQPADSDYKSDLSHHTNRITPHLPASYPTSRLPQLNDPSFFQKLEQEGLFFAFYFQPGSIQQFAAAKDLKRQAWRYNIEHKAWFQRSGEPKATTKDYEQGSYIYFDKSLSLGNSENPSEVNGWCYRKKDNFTFRYDQLEDELH